MAVAVQLDFRGGTLDQYDQINEMIGLLPGGPASPHEIFHCVMKTDEGFRVVDVWESREAFEKFEQEKLGPAYKQVGVVNPPETQLFEVHNFLAGARWRG